MSVVLKLRGIRGRASFYIRQFPIRIKRLGMHVIRIDLSKGLLAGILIWLMQFGFLIMDLLAVPELYETIMDIAKWKTRPLTNKERIIAKAVYTDSLNLDMIRVDEKARFGPKYGNFAYVSYHTINSFGKISNAVFVHELMHIWQFTHLGSVYIVNALLAQQSKDGYDYKGLQRMSDTISAGKTILDFNFEQQADIICDYYRISEGRKAQWSSGGLQDLDTYQYFVNQVQNPKFLGLA